MFEHLKKPRDLMSYSLMKGVPDYGNLSQFNLYETGYSFLVVCQIPKFLERLKAENEGYKVLIDNYVHILENEFRGLDGLDNMTVDTLEITNGIATLNMIGKVNQQSQATVSMRFFEKSGSTITKLHELFLSGIKDPMTQAKTYHGLINGKNDGMDAGYENETFILLYIVTDNTYRQLERAFLLLCAQPNSAEISMYNSEKGDIQQKELSVEYNCFPVKGDAVNKAAKEVLDWMVNDENPDHVVLDSSNYHYTGIEAVKVNKPNGI